MGVPFFVPGRCGSFGPVGSIWWGVCDTPLPGYDYSVPHVYPGLHVVGFSFSPSLTAEEAADVTQAEDEAADRNGRAAKQ